MPKQYNSIFSETSDPYETKIDKNIIFSTLKIDSSPTCVESLSYGEVYSIQHYVIKFVTYGRSAVFYGYSSFPR
jgi:hypothetical protein